MICRTMIASIEAGACGRSRSICPGVVFHCPPADRPGSASADLRRTDEITRITTHSSGDFPQVDHQLSPISGRDATAIDSDRERQCRESSVSNRDAQGRACPLSRYRVLVSSPQRRIGRSAGTAAFMKQRCWHRLPQTPRNLIPRGISPVELFVPNRVGSLA